MSSDGSLSDRGSEVLRLMKKGDDAFNAHDFEAMHAAHHPDMVAHIVGSAEPVRGADAHRATMEVMIGAFPDVRVENDPYPLQFAHGDWLTVITKARGTFSGDLVTPDGSSIPPTGKSFELDFSTTARWEGELLIEEYVFWDTALQARQIGVA